MKNDAVEKKVPEKKSSIDRKVVKVTDTKITKASSSGIQKVSRNSFKTLATSNTENFTSSVTALDKRESSKI